LLRARGSLFGKFSYLSLKRLFPNLEFFFLYLDLLLKESGLFFVRNIEPLFYFALNLKVKALCFFSYFSGFLK